MPRQNFLTKDFFVHASEHDLKQALLEIPHFAKAISFSGENTLVHSWRFLYVRENGKDQQLSVSLLPMNDGHMHVTLHSTYANGHSFHKDAFVVNALDNFESALRAALKGEGNAYLEHPLKGAGGRRVASYIMLMLSSIGLLLFWKKMG